MKDLAVIKIQSDPKYLSVIRMVTVKMGELQGLSESAIEDIKLGVDEACSNVIKHAYGGDIHQSILVKYKMTPKGFEVLIESHQKGIRYLPI